MIVVESCTIPIPFKYAMVGTAWPEGGRKAFNVIYPAQNLGVAIGPAIAGIIADYSYQGIVNSTATIGRMFGPFVGGVLGDTYGMTAMFLILTSFMIFAIIPSLLYDRPLRKAKSII